MTNSMHKINKIAMLIGGILLVVLGLLVKGTVPDPVGVLHLWQASDSLPPMWILGLLWLTGYGVIGGAWLGVLGMRACGTEGEILRYKGGMFLVLAVFFSFVWYLLLFGMQAMLLSWLSLCAALLAAAVGAVCYLRLHPLAGGCILLVGLWWIYLLFIHVTVMLHI